MALVLKILQVLAIICATVLLAGAYDVFNLGLKKMIGPFAIGPIIVFMLFSILPVFLTPKPKTPEEEEAEDLGEKLAEVQAKVNSRLTDVQTKLDSLTGQDKETLQEENKILREQIEAIQQAERDKVASDARSLRQRNEELEEQIKKWAIEAVGNNVAKDAAEEEAATSDAA